MSEKKPYDKIYLIGWYAEYPRPGDFGDEVTWCQDPIGEDDDCPDIEYIRVDLADEQLTQAQERIAELEEFMQLIYDWKTHPLRQFAEKIKITHHFLGNSTMDLVRRIAKALQDKEE